MPLIHVTTFIAAPQERVFDLSRSVDLHKNSMNKYQEKIIKGTMTGLMNTGDEVTWKAKHLFKERIMRVRISECNKPDFFIDEQVEGDFASMKHEHYFKSIENGTIMIDQFHFNIRFGLFGTIINKVYLVKYMTRLLRERNETIKKIAEGNQWKQYLEK
ncbi:MAG TPA: SRPBCC family protein [Flavisolibacter sp.]|nr:SRPBCC family protein [Flavisolibacter sp.]